MSMPCYFQAVGLLGLAAATVQTQRDTGQAIPVRTALKLSRLMVSCCEYRVRVPTHFSTASLVKWGEWGDWASIEETDTECSLYERQRQCNAATEAAGSTITCGDCEKDEIDTQRKCAGQ